ncbi:unnamed protein product [Protopolystoma xenopodis]|uniref:Uncharacterized protein n=1 Tax=Protopolystoma xenopodis TaxID=117903 RepID=A0A3S5AAX9_9PLAT|nr:unnamed protein product [Protopolystoma xenopodis]
MMHSHRRCLDIRSRRRNLSSRPLSGLSFTVQTSLLYLLVLLLTGDSVYIQASPSFGYSSGLAQRSQTGLEAVLNAAAAEVPSPTGGGGVEEMVESNGIGEPLRLRPVGQPTELARALSIEGFIEPPRRPAVFSSPQALRHYLRRLNEYFAIIGRPRSVSSRRLCHCFRIRVEFRGYQ